MTRSALTAFVAASALLAAGVAACSPEVEDDATLERSVEEAGDDLQGAGDALQDNAAELGRETEQGLEDLGDGIEDGLDEAGDAAEDAADGR